ncbi:MAG: thioredoxin domain-containing protein [Myxococcota bacterium]
MSHRAAIFAALLGLAATGATCKGGDGAPPRDSAPPPPAAPLVKAPAVLDIESIDMALIPPAARGDVVRILNETFAYCGCTRSVAACLADKAQCTCPNASQRMADFVVNQFQQGASTEEVETQLIEGFSEGYNKKPFDLDPEGQPAKGNASAKVVIAEFADFRCPHCAAAFEVLDRVVKNRDDIQLLYYYFPLTGGGEISLVAAEAAEEARAQGKFWEMAGLMYRNQHALSTEDLLRYGTQAGLDVAKLAKALDTRAHRKKVLADKRIGERLGITSTPSIYVNGRPFGLSRTEQIFAMRVDMEHGRGSCD